MGKSFFLPHSPGALRTPSVDSLVPVATQLRRRAGGGRRLQTMRENEQRQPQITASFSASIMSCITQLLVAYVKPVFPQVSNA